MSYPVIFTTSQLRLNDFQKYGIRTGNLEVVQILLDHGADPNLPFGKFET